MFLGRYEHTLDEKGRLTIPVRYREELADGAYITLGFDENLLLFTQPFFEQVYQKGSQLSITDPTARELQRQIFSNADRLEIDRTGRILIPPFLREAVQLNGDAVILGMGNYFEIWPRQAWLDHTHRISAEPNAVGRFAALDISLER